MTVRAWLQRTIAKALPALTPVVRGNGGWYPIIRESFTGAWQQNADLVVSDVLSYGAVYACITSIATDVSKLSFDLKQETEDGVWIDTENPAFSPVLRKPNRYQNRIMFFQNWLTSKLIHGNTYVLKERDGRGVVTALYVLDPTRVWPLVAPDGSVYYQTSRDDLAGLTPQFLETQPVVPASEIIHDVMVPLYHPLCGVSPIYAAGRAAMQGLSIQSNSNNFFTNGSIPSGVITVPGQITQEIADRLKSQWMTATTGTNAGKVGLLSAGMTYNPLLMSAVDAQLIDQLKWTAEDIARCFHVPGFLIGIGPYPPYTDIEAALQLYYAQCIQAQCVQIEQCLDEGLGLLTPINGTQYGTEFSTVDLIWLATATKTNAARDAIGAGAMSPNEARLLYFGLGPVAGGETPYMQQQMFSLKALAQRDAMDPFATPAPAPAATPAAPPPPSTQQLSLDELAAAVEVWAA